MKSKQLTEKILAMADIKVGGDRPWDIIIHNDKVYDRIFKQGSLGLGESYMEGWWDCQALDQLFDRVLSAKLDQQLKQNVRLLVQILASKILNMQSKTRSLKVAKMHYNLDNDMYSKMLGESMAYTCAYFKDTDNLDEAQHAKYDLVCRKLNLQKGDRVLELGCGWGGFARHAAKHYGCEMVSVNIAKEQLKFARDICQGLPVTFVEADYRDDKVYNPEAKPFDKVVSIGLFEHVGYKNYPSFMRLVKRNLKDGGLFLLHTIGGNVSLTKADPWISKYIFPGGMLPSMRQLTAAFEGVFVMEDWHNIGPHYDKTLMAWHQNYLKHWPEFEKKYDQRFDRMWQYYLLSCAGMFRARDAQLWQVVFSKGVLEGGYQSIR